MNKIYYFTTAQEENLFKNNLNKWNVVPNLSNQNFHNKLIRCLGLNNNVEVISIRPINNNYKDKEIKESVIQKGNITWKHIEVRNSKIDKFLHVFGRIVAISEMTDVNNKGVVITDTTNLNLLVNAIKFAKKSNLKIIGICTDNPKNISFTSSSYKEKLIKKVQTLDGFISLTPKLDELFNVRHKPSIIIDGVSEPRIKKELRKEKYIFFGGSLMRKYGVYNLIEAFSLIKDKDLELFICGHHEESDLLDTIKSHKNVKYLKALNSDQVAEYEQSAILTVNPRPKDPQIDDYSIPSKTLEYLSNGVLSVSVDNEYLKERYKESIIWAKSSDVINLKDAIEYALGIDEKEKEKRISLGQQYISQFTSFEVINNKINDLIDKVLLD